MHYRLALMLLAAWQLPAATLFADTAADGREQEKQDKWADAMAAFEEADAEHPPRPGGVVFVGSSSIRRWDLPRWFGDLRGPVLNRGFGGSELEDSVRHLDLLVLRHKPRAIVLYAGDNDINGGKSAERVEQDFIAFAAGVRAASPDTPIYYLAIKPSIARWAVADEMREANRRVSVLCEKDPMLTFLDIWTPMLGPDGRPRRELLVDDNLHLTDAGYDLWASVVRDALAAQPQD